MVALGEPQDRIAELEAEVDRLHKAHELQTELIGVIAHEVKSPLTVIAGFALTLQTEHSLGHELRAESLEVIARQALMLGRFVDNLLETGRSLYPSSTNDVGVVSEAVNRACERSLDLYGRDKVHIEVSLDDATPAIDQHALELIMTNLISNAMKFSPPDGKVVVTSEVEGSFLVIRISNEGPPMSEAECESIFAPFKRGASTSSEVQGVGLGLYIVRRFTEAYDGKVSAASSKGIVSIEVKLPVTSFG